VQLLCNSLDGIAQHNNLPRISVALVLSTPASLSPPDWTAEPIFGLLTEEAFEWLAQEQHEADQILLGSVDLGEAQRALLIVGDLPAFWHCHQQGSGRIPLRWQID